MEYLVSDIPNSFNSQGKLDGSLTFDLSSCVLFEWPKGSGGPIAILAISALLLRSKWLKLRPQLQPNQIARAIWHLKNKRTLESLSPWHKGHKLSPEPNPVVMLCLVGSILCAILQTNNFCLSWNFSFHNSGQSIVWFQIYMRTLHFISIQVNATSE